VPPFFGVPSPSAPLPPPVPAMPWPVPSQGVPVSPPRPFYRIKIGDFGSGLAKRATGNAGRWRELLEANPELSTYTDDKGATQIRPWKIGQKLMLPAGWEKLTEGIQAPQVVPIDEVRKAAK
jgi:nucleoid-associated protein YgaU